MPADTADDAINPDHYKWHPSNVECIEIVEHFGFLLGNAIKYLWRAGRKGGSSELEDLKKARWYIDRQIARLEEPTETKQARTAVVDVRAGRRTARTW